MSDPNVCKVVCKFYGELKYTAIVINICNTSHMHVCALVQYDSYKLYVTIFLGMMLSCKWMDRKNIMASFHTTIFIGDSDQQIPLVLVQYLFSGREHEITRILPHGNAKKRSSYTRLFPSTKSKLKNSILDEEKTHKRFLTRFILQLVMLLWQDLPVNCPGVPTTFTTQCVMQDKRRALKLVQTRKENRKNCWR